MSITTQSTGAIDLDRLVTAWNAANYLTVAQIYLQANPLLREPLVAEHIKPRLLGHWGTSPALNLIYVQLNRLIQQRDCDVLYVTGPGHGGPAIVANVYLEGTYSEVYPAVSQDEKGLLRLVRQFSTPGGIPSHVSVPTPGSIHEGGELGYALAHAFGAAFDNPDLIVACVVGDGEAETGPLEGSWKGTRFLNPRRDGAVLPILQLNGYKISGPTVLARVGDEPVRGLLTAHGYDVHIVSGDDGRTVHEEFAHTLDRCYERIREIQVSARAGGAVVGARWPAIVLRTPKGWTGPREVDGLPVEGTFRAHQVPLSNVRGDPAHLRQLEEWLRSYRPDQLFDADGRPAPEVTELAPMRLPARGASVSGCATSIAITPTTSVSSVRTRPTATASAPSLTSRTAAWSQRSTRTTTTSALMDGSWRCSPSISARAGSRATCSPAGTACSPPTRRSRWCRHR